MHFTQLIKKFKQSHRSLNGMQYEVNLVVTCDSHTTTSDDLWCRNMSWALYAALNVLLKPLRSKPLRFMVVRQIKKNTERGKRHLLLYIFKVTAIESLEHFILMFSHQSHGVMSITWCELEMFGSEPSEKLKCQTQRECFPKICFLLTLNETDQRQVWIHDKSNSIFKTALWSQMRINTISRLNGSSGVRIFSLCTISSVSSCLDYLQRKTGSPM